MNGTKATEAEIKTVMIHSTKYNSLKTFLSNLSKDKEIRNHYNYSYTFQDHTCYEKVNDTEIVSYFLGHKPEFKETCETILKRNKLSPYKINEYLNELNTPPFFIQRTGIPTSRFLAIENDLCDELILKENPSTNFQIILNVELCCRNTGESKRYCYAINDVKQIYEKANYSDLEKTVFKRLNSVHTEEGENTILVKKYSMRYNCLKSLLTKYPLITDIKTEFKLFYLFTSPIEYVNSNPETIIRTLAQQDKELMHSFESIKKNRTNMEWIMAQEDVLNQTPISKISHLNISYTEFISIEKQLCQKMLETAIVDMTINLELSYQNEQNRPSKTYVYNFETLSEVLNKAESLNTNQITNASMEKPNISKEKITPTLRYDTLKRDGFHCALCGLTAQDGAKLEAFFVVPLSEGGKAELNNLRTLCENCSKGINSEFAQKERTKMNPSLRESILQRDGFRCVLCGATEKDGTKLHIDHILPISKGGKTTPDNLRTLCDRCNFGKHDKFDEDGPN